MRGTAEWYVATTTRVTAKLSVSRFFGRLNTDQATDSPSTNFLCEVVIRFDEHGGVVALDRELGSVHHQLEVGTDAGSLFGRT